MTEYEPMVKKHIHKIAPEADLEQLDPDDDLGSTLDLDSMDYFRLLTALSEELNFDIPEEDYAKLRTVKTIAGYCREALGAKRAGT